MTRSRRVLVCFLQCGELDSYVNEFSQLSLQVPELDEHSRAVLFAKGLAKQAEKRSTTRTRIWRKPYTAFTAEQSLQLVDSDRTSRSQLHGSLQHRQDNPGQSVSYLLVAEFRKTLESESPGRKGYVSSVTRPDGLPPNPRARPRTAEVRSFASARCLSRTDELRKK